MEFLLRLFDTSDFPARWSCGRWSTGHGWLHILSDLGVLSAYFAIPLVFGYFLARRKDLPFRSIFLLFAAFIVLCGTTHLMEAVIFWWPAYRFAGVLKLLTAIVSWITVFALIRVGPNILAMRSPVELERLVLKRTAESEAAVAALRAERELLRTTLTSIGDAVITTDVAGRITNMNAVAETLTGWTVEGATGQLLDAVFIIVNEETRRPVENPATRAVREGVVVGLANHTVMIAKDGKERPIDDSAAPIRTAGEVVGCVLVFRDISERHLQEAKLRERERQFVTLAESIPQLAWMANPDGHIFWYNRRWYDFTGTTPEQMAGWGWQSVHDPDVLPKVLDRWKASLASGEPFDMVFPLKGKDGVFRSFLTRVEPVKDDEGQVVRWFGTNTDVDESERTRAALREKEERLRLAVEATGVGILDYDPITGEQSLSEAALRIWGLPPGSDTSGEALINAVHPEDRAMVRAAAVASLDPNGDGVLAVKHRLIRPDGNMRWVAANARTLFSENGLRRAVRSVGTMLDVTQVVQSEERLRFQLDLTKSITDNATTAIFMMDDKSRCTFMNPAAELMTGFSLKEVDGGILHDFIHHHHPDGRHYPMPECPIDRALPEGGEVRDHEDLFFRKDGTTFPVVCNARVIYKEGVAVGTVIEVRDTTKEREAAAALRESESRFTVALQKAKILVYTTDADLRYTWIHNPHPAFKPAEVIGRHDEELLPPEQAEPLVRIKRGVLESGIGRRDEFAIDINGEHLVYDLTVEPLWDGSGCVGVTVAAMEITERKKAEDELRRLTSELSDADRKKDEFLATLAHELRNPLAPIRNGLQLMKLAGHDAETVEKSRLMMERQLEQMVRLVDDLMDVSRIASGKIELKKQRVQLSAVIGSAVETCRPLIEQMGHELTVALPEQPIILDADLTRLAQVLSNLLNNAAKYSERGCQIRLTVEREGSDVVVSVKDTGIGIPADNLKSIFDMFSQVDRSLEKSQGGLGIGLTLAKRLVAMHDGSIEAKSDGPGQGSEFVVRLPVDVVASRTLTAETNEPAARKSSLRILIVDDNKDGADSLAMMLKMMGNETRTAYDGKEGIKLGEDFQPNVVLLDIGLPKLNGYEACRHIRQQPWGKEVILIAVTGWGQMEDRQRSHEAGFNHHLVKPVDVSTLMKLLAELNIVK